MADVHIRDLRFDYRVSSDHDLFVDYPVLCGTVSTGDDMIYPSDLYSTQDDDLCEGCIFIRFIAEAEGHWHPQQGLDIHYE